MKKDSKARIVTVAVVLALLAALAARKMGWRLPEAKASEDPQDTIYAMLSAARAGDVKTYLAEFTGQMEASLRQSLAETTESGFAKYLRDSNAAIKGVAVSDPMKITDQEAKVRVEYVYQDRNEAQTMYLEKGPNGWKIARADSDERIKTLIPYGTPVK
jgi:Na+-transporting NADH:ubiquinone oxidoreductase subunit NqrC